MISGSITINGVDDKQLRTLITVKIEHEGSLVFNPQQLQAIQRPGYPQPPQPPQPREQIYNNAVVSWNGEDGLKAVKQLLHELTETKQ